MPSYYTYFMSNEAKECIYIGYTTNPTYRLNNHEANKSWWHEVRAVTLYHHATFEEAVKFEQDYLARLRPKYNVEGVTKPYRAPTKPTEPRKANWDDVLSRLDDVEQLAQQAFTAAVEPFPYNDKAFRWVLWHIEHGSPSKESFFPCRP